MFWRIRTLGRADAENAVDCQPEDSKDMSISLGLNLGARHLQCVMILLGVAVSYCIRSHLSVTIVSMTEKSNFNDAPVLEWDSAMKGTIMSSFYWGHIFVLVPAGQLCEKFGPKFPLIIAMSSCGIIMILTPIVAIYGGFYWIIFVRILLGITQAVVLPSINVVFSKWVPPGEKGMLFCFVLGGMDIGVILSMTMTGALVDSQWGWPSVFYACGGIAILWALAFAYVGANSPHEYSTISEQEKSYILKSLSNNSQGKEKLKTPWRAIVSSMPLHAISIAQSVCCWGYYTLLFQAPSYINAVLGLSMTQSGFIAALPYVSSHISGYVYAATSYWLNKKNIWSRNTLLKSWNSISFWGAAIPIGLLAYAEDSKVLTVTLLVLGTTLFPACHAGYFSNHLDLSPNFAGTLMGITTFISTICTLGSPLYAGFVVTDRTSVYSWRIVFLTASGMLFVGNLFFVLFATTEVQPWNFPPDALKPNPEAAISKEKMAEESDDNSKRNVEKRRF